MYEVFYILTAVELTALLNLFTLRTDILHNLGEMSSNPTYTYSAGQQQTSAVGCCVVRQAHGDPVLRQFV